MAKLTYLDALNVAIELTEGEVAEKLVSLREQIAKRNTAERKPTKTQRENEGYKASIVEAMPTTPTTITELIGLVPELAELSNQRVSAMLTALTKEEDAKIVRVQIGRKACFYKIA